MGKVLYILLGGFFTSLVDFFLKFVSKRVALGLTAVTIFMTFTSVFIAALYALIQSIAVAMPSEITLAIGWFIPSNAGVCLSAYFAALLARWIYDLKTKTMTYTLGQF